ncbi:MAG TPA: S41 family peptidase [Gemmatimonadaceae bacterium]|jgi:carboxyl-terminal processing protease|nr:S41 family peptidase [Gemmatimonadaceae bacterium]
MRSRAVIAVAVLAGALGTGGWLLQRGIEHGSLGYMGAKLFDDVLVHVANQYVDSIPMAELYTRAAAGMVDELGDPHSVYLTGRRLGTLTESTTGNYAGLGIQIDVRNGWITIISPLPGTPAERAGIQPGDRIVAVNGKSTQGYTPDEARETLRGPEGSKVSITVDRPGVEALLSFTLRRGEIHVASVRHPTILAGDVGYVDLTIFSESSDSELRAAVDSLRRQGMKTLIFDLRSNPGGLLEQGVAISDLFLDQGEKIVSMRGRAPGTDHDFTDEARELWPDLRLITLVDGHSASAAEIVAGALQDHDRSVIVGSTTYGKGSAQSVFKLGDAAGALKLTTARWYTPSGRSIQKPLADTTEDDGAAEPDTLAEKPLSKREGYRTDSGRIVYGGGGITPDLIVANVDSASAMLSLWRQVGQDIPAFRDALTKYALSVKARGTVTSRDFDVTPQMRQEFWRLAHSQGVSMDEAQQDSTVRAVDDLLGFEIARFVFGSEAAFQRQVKDDRVIAAAMELANGARSEEELLARAAERRAARREDVPAR